MIHDEVQDITMSSNAEDAAAPLKQWRSQFEGNNLQAHSIVQFLESSSAAYYAVAEKEPMCCVYDAEGAKCGIVDVVEEFMLGDNAQTVYDRIAMEGVTPAVCGHVFKINEPTYSCRECGVDNTCVLCVVCFKQSAHRFHKYKMGTSGGGGCCDCGDMEAWKRDHACTLHTTTAAKGVPTDEDDDDDTNTTNETRPNALPPPPPPNPLASNVINAAMQERCELVFDAVLKYCTQSLRIETDAALKATTGTGRTDEEQIYCTVMYNDETHTFEQVIQTLTRIVGCSQKDAVDFVSSIDREGRAVVKCAPFDVCKKLKDEIENTSPRAMVHVAKALQLKVAVLHMNAIACQQLALQLIGWLQEFCARHAIFRQRFTAVILAKGHLMHIMTYDWKLWKTARLAWHHLLITAVLMEYENKKLLALAFMQIYPSLMADFIRDDHDHSFSIVAMSVQLFTVPSIAQHLIAYESAFFKLMHTFYSESIEKYVSKKVLMFARQTTNQNVFKRAAFILFDLKYLLSFRPDVWTDALRKNFLHGVQVLLKLLKEMQGMDSVFRQTGQHMEYEPEWESAFNLHIKLAHVITLVLEWCGTDKVVLVKVYRMVMANLDESEFILNQAKPEMKQLGEHVASTLVYDVMSKHVSIHLPLSRFYAGLYLHMERYGYTYENIMSSSVKESPEELIEPILCTQTMIAQVHSGLWRRNGYSLLNQLYFYRNVKCRGEMLDRDVVMLQIGASLMQSNDFMLHVMNKFGMLDWVVAGFEARHPDEDGIRQTINMLDEMLDLLIVVLGERHMPGVGRVTERERLIKELVQQLCIKPHSHSELNKALTEAQQADAEEIIPLVAEFRKPTGRTDQKGVYVLRPAFYDEYNMFYYHYTKEEKSRSEETHRTRRKEAKLLDCCPPPRLPRLCQNFGGLVTLFVCDGMLLVMETVLRRSLDLKARHFSESHLQKVLHLIGYALHEEESREYEGFRFVERAAARGFVPMLEELSNSARVEVHRDLLLWTIGKFAAVAGATAAVAASGGDDLTMSSATSSSPDGEKPAAAAIEALAASTGGDGNDRMDLSPFAAVAAEADNVVATAAAAATTTAASSTIEAERLEKEARQRLAAERRAKIMAQMKSAQTSFMTTNAALFKLADQPAAVEQAAAAAAAAPSTPNASNSSFSPTIELSASSSSSGGDFEASLAALTKAQMPVASGSGSGTMDWQNTPVDAAQTPVDEATVAAPVAPLPPANMPCLGRPKAGRLAAEVSVPFDEYTCILCSEDAFVTKSSACMVFSAFIQTSKVMAHANNQGVSPHVNSCGHVMHARCWAKYFENETLKETRRPNRNRAPGTFHIDKKEFLCPLCRCLSNVVLPVPTPLSHYGVPEKLRAEVEQGDEAEGGESCSNGGDDAAAKSRAAPCNFAVWFAIMERYTLVLNQTDQFTEITENQNDADHCSKMPDLPALCVPIAPYEAFRACWPPAVDRNSLATELNRYIEEFIEMARRVSPFPYAAEVCEPYLVAWLACAYTIEALEMQMRATGKPLKDHMSIRQTSGLRGLLRTGGLLSVCAPTHVAAKLAVHLRSLLSTVFVGYNRASAATAAAAAGGTDVTPMEEDDAVAAAAAAVVAAAAAAGGGAAAAAAGDESISVIAYDVFKMLASIVFMMPTVLYVKSNECTVPNGHMSEFYLVQLMHVANVVKILLLHEEPAAADAVAASPDNCSTSMDIDGSETTTAADPLIAFYNAYNFCVHGGKSSMTRARLDDIVAAGSATFLRCATLLFNTIADAPMPDELAVLSTDGRDVDKYPAMCTYLGLNADAGVYLTAPDAAAVGADDADALATRQTTYRFAVQLAEHPSHAQLRADAAATSLAAVEARRAIVPCVTPISAFVELPEDYSDLINSVSQYTCPNNVRDDTRNPTMCLICGAILCSMTYCCQVEVNGATVGACTAHTISCGAGVGAFLRIRDCEVLLLGFNKGCFVSAPYLDEYGETDQGLRRGNALRLCPERLRKLHMMWLTHCMHEDIARLAETNSPMIQTQWQNM